MISPEQAAHIAKLARLALSDDERERLGHDLSRIVDFVEKLNEVDVANVEPLNGGTELSNQTRSDEQTPEQRELSNPETAAALLKAAPASEKNYLKVKSVF